MQLGFRGFVLKARMSTSMIETKTLYACFQAIIKYVVGEGYPLERYEIVTNFPRRILTNLDETKSLKDLQLFPQETVFVQQRA